VLIQFSSLTQVRATLSLQPVTPGVLRKFSGVTQVRGGELRKSLKVGVFVANMGALFSE
jgi:hypothetical protein